MNKLITTTLLFFCLGSFGCSAKVSDNRFESTAEAQHFDYIPEMCEDWQIEYNCANCPSEEEGYCATVGPEWQCWSGFKYKSDLEQCVEKYGSENCTFCD